VTVNKNQTLSIEVVTEGGGDVFAVFYIDGSSQGSQIVPLAVLAGDGEVPWLEEYAGYTVKIEFYSFWYGEGPNAIEPALCTLETTYESAGGGATYTPAPLPAQTSSITPCSAASGSGAGGNSFAIAGAFASPITNVSVGGVTLPASAWVQTPTSVTITMPAGTAGTVPIQLDNGRRPALSPCDYTYLTSASVQPLAKALKLKVFFGLGSNKITATESAKLKALAKKLAGLGAKITIVVTGYAQPTPGSEKTDGALSKRRASAVAAYLTKAGVTTKLTYAGAGRTTINTASSRYVEIVADNS
jgi:outer membrane protein OmpA-like peptidoglycan-associated protein